MLVQGIGQLFVAGPPVVRGGTGEDLTKEELGGADVHRRSGAVERVVATEQDAFDVVRTFLSYLPDSVYGTPPVRHSGDPVDRREDRLIAAVPRNPRTPYRIAPVLEAVFDAGSVFPYAEYGGRHVTALARLDGHPSASSRPTRSRAPPCRSRARRPSPAWSTSARPSTCRS